MAHATLHYVYDPLCGWCYAAAPLLKAARDVGGLNIHMHAGGMWTGANAKRFTPELRTMLISGDQRIHQLTGQVFGEAYLNQLIYDDTAVLDSAPPTRAILAAEQLAQRGLDLHRAIQTAHWVQGRHISREHVLFEIAGEIGLNVGDFTAEYNATDAAVHIQNTRELMTQWRMQGFPSMVLERNGALQRIDHSGFYGRSEEFKMQLAAAL